MTKSIKSAGIALGALLLTMSPAIANAERIYFLVGVRHVYRIGPVRDLHLTEREEIEKTYADGVAADQATYQQHVDGGASAIDEAKARDEDLDQLALDRDRALGAIFDIRDDIRDRHPELQVQGDGPYQVMGIEYHMRRDVEVFDQFIVYAPWPGYIVVGEPYGGWIYGRPYAPGLFFNIYIGWQTHYGGPRYYGGFYGHDGYIPFNHGHFSGSVTVYAHTNGYAHAAFVRAGGIRAGGRGTGSFNRAPSGYSHTSGAGSPAPSRDNRPSDRATGSFNRSPGGYTHSRSDQGAPTRTAPPSRGTAPSDRTSTPPTRSSGGYSHSGSTDRSNSSSPRGSSHSRTSDKGSSDKGSHSKSGGGSSDKKKGG